MTTAERVEAGCRFAAVLVVALALPDTAEAYIGPGAGFALLSSFLVLFTTIVLDVASLFIWPFRAVWRLMMRKTRPKPWIKRLIVVGFDGQDPKLTERFMRQGRLPNFEKLQRMGCYRELRTTYPSLSPVAWSSFATGTNPGRHNIFDFLGRDDPLEPALPVSTPDSYAAELAAATGRFYTQGMPARGDPAPTRSGTSSDQPTRKAEAPRELGFKNLN